jgi:protease IV
MSFLKVFFASVLGFFVSLALVALVVVGIFAAAIASLDTEPTVNVRSNSVLVVDLAKSYPEHRATEGIAELASAGTAISLRELVAAIEDASEDSRISGMRIKASGNPGSWAAAEEIRRAVETFRASGKFVAATVGERGISEGSYFVASAAESIIAVPGSMVEINGIAAVLPFFKPALDRLGVQAQVVRAGAFKSAVEPFILDSASAETQLMTRELVESTFSRFRSVVADSRKITPATLQNILSTRGLMTAHEARAAGLFDAILYEDQIDSMLLVRSKHDADDHAEVISVGEYARAGSSSREETAGDDQVAVVYAVGEIRAGKSASGTSPLSGGVTLGNETFADAMETARESESVKAVVVRIDSPGGEAGPSESMWREIKLTAAKKPVIASMGSTAASGGYFLAAACDTIVAEPTTITGSIGVFGLWFTLRDFFRETLGVNMQVIRSDSLADMGSMLRAPTDLERAILQRSVDTTYQKFLSIVSQGRGISIAKANELGQGRVYTGARAKELGLVDELGGLDRAVDIAAARAGLAHGAYRLRILPRRKSFFEAFTEILENGDIMALAGWQRDPREAVRAELERRSGVQMLGPVVSVGVE